MQYVRAHGVVYTGVRAWQRLFARSSKRYARWFAAHQPDEAELAAQRAHVFASPLKFSIIVPVYNTRPEFLRELADMIAQTENLREAFAMTLCGWGGIHLNGKVQTGTAGVTLFWHIRSPIRWRRSRRTVSAG